MAKQKSNFKHKKVILAVALAFAVILATAGTYAWFTASDNVVNRFESKSLGGSVGIFERFTPPTNWKPGQEITKEVGVANTGETGALVRMSFDEALTVLANGGAISETAVQADSVSGTRIPVTMDPTAYNTASPSFTGVSDDDFASGHTTPDYVTILRSVSATDSTAIGYVAYFELGVGKFQAIKLADGAIKTNAAGKIVLDTAKFGYRYYDGSVSTTADWTVGKPAVTATSALDANIALNFLNTSATINAGKWFYNTADGYFYYIGELLPGTTSPLLLNSVALDEDAGNEYAQITYDLNVKMEAIQNTADALAEWVPNSGGTAALYAAMVAFCS